MKAVVALAWFLGAACLGLFVKAEDHMRDDDVALLVSQPGTKTLRIFPADAGPTLPYTAENGAVTISSRNYGIEVHQTEGYVFCGPPAYSPNHNGTWTLISGSYDIFLVPRQRGGRELSVAISMK